MRAVNQAATGAAKKAQFVNLPLAVHRDPLLSSDDVRVLIEILAHDWPGNENGCTASQATIAEACSLSESTVKRAIKRLHYAGYLLAPQPLTDGRSRTGTRLKVSGKVRAGRPFASAVEGGGVRGNPPVDASLLETQPTAPEPKAAAHAFARRFRPNLKRYPLADLDAPRLRLLDSWGCPDSEDLLGVMFAVIAQREADCGRQPDAQRVRALFDAASRNRRLSRAKVESRSGLLLDGLEKGYLLGHGPKLRLEDLPPGAREALRGLAKRAEAGATISDQTLSDYGVSRTDLHSIAQELATEEQPGEPQGDEAPTVSDDAADLREGLRSHLDAGTYGMLIVPTGISVEAQAVTLRAKNRFIADLLRERVLPVVSTLGYDVTIAVE